MSKLILLTLTTLFVCSIFLASQVSPANAYPLDISVATDKSVYNVGETVHISGNITFNLAPVSGVLVALQINDRTNPYAFRTLYSGPTPPSGQWYVEITNVFIGDSSSNPITSIRRGSICYIWIYYQNTYTNNLDVTIAFTIYDVNQSPLFAQAPVSQSVPPGSGYFVVYIWQVPTNAGLGPATIYASAFSALPQNGGTSYSPERSNTFNIVTATRDTVMQTAGTFTNTFMIPKQGSRLGNYTIYVASFYQGFKDHATTSYQVILIGDINSDGTVNFKDAILLGVAFGSKPGDLNWDSRADINGDGTVNYKDAILLGSNFGNSGIP
jgi:hypothetical protein